MSEFAIETTNLTKRFGDVVAVDNLNLKIPYREVFGLLGPNGAGKTTTLNMLCTVLKQSSGKALVDGHDIDKEPAAVRKSIGIVFQDPSIDDRLTGRENLEMHAALYGVPFTDTKERIEDVLSLVELEDKAENLMRTYSGGMRRRLELARGLLHHPKILFLDEPTIGLDPQTREHIWEYIKELIHRKQITVVLTTHYMEEADELCDRVGIIDYGRIVALDTPENLKHKIGGDVITAEVSRPEELALELKKHDSTLTLGFTEKIIRVTVPEGEKYISHIIHAADTLNMNVDSVTVKKPTLNDVFLSYTGHEIRDETGKTMGTMLSIRRRRIK
ncbi:MAG: ATP-binding cassette domain-containing protein [Candidatus Wukongarchaeota archaeon]|nr:ATP-binding cassette domain-containing protein [Candidatus Wukongarchaeota archaeon]